MRAFRILPAFLLILCLCLCFLPAAFAEGAREYDGRVITAFEALDAETIELDHKIWLGRLRERFPEKLRVLTEGGLEQNIEVTWECVEDYDDDLELFHFVPSMEGFTLAEGLKPPVLTVRVTETFVIPPLIERSARPVETGSSDGPQRSAVYPAYYNSYELGCLPPVRNQTPYATCWSFAVLGSIEADLIHDGAAGTDIDLSELHLAYYTTHGYYDEKNCNVGDSVDSYTDAYLIGGHEDVAYRVLADMLGPAAEADVPYAWGTDYKPGGYAGRASAAAQITEAVRFSSSDTGGIKEAILQHGGIDASIYSVQAEQREAVYSAVHNSYYVSKAYFAERGMRPRVDHSIMLVGWDDGFSRENFRGEDKPPEDGAWLVRNSWGVDDYDLYGYFWLSYYDAGLLSESVYVFDAQNWRYDHCYSYVSLPFPGKVISLHSGDTVSQIFHVDGGERVEAVGIETDSDQVALSITLRRGEEAVTTPAFCKRRGFHLIPLDTPLTVAEESDVILEISFFGEGMSMSMEDSDEVEVSESCIVRFSCGSGGMSVNGVNTGEDGWLQLYTVDCGTPAGEGVPINAKNFPNVVFRNAVLDQADLDHDGYLSEEEIAAVTSLDLTTQSDAAGIALQTSAAESDVAHTLKGVERFTELTYLDCRFAGLTELDLSTNTKLQELNCNFNRLERLTLPENSPLHTLKCSHNMLSSLDLSRTPALQRLSCYQNMLTSLDLSHTPALQELDCGKNALTSLDLSHTPALQKLYCDENALTSLDLSHTPALQELLCGGNALTELDLSHTPALQKLYCNGNVLTSLDLSHTPALQKLYCNGNVLTSLDLSHLPELQEFECNNNALTKLDLSHTPELWKLWCYGNALTSLDISGCEALLYLVSSTVATISDNAAIFASMDQTLQLILDKTVVLITAAPDLILPASLTAIGEEAFAGGAFVYAVVPEGTVSIGARAFAGCENLAYIYIPATTADIADDAFGDEEPAILGAAGSPAEEYAEAHGLRFAAIG